MSNGIKELEALEAAAEPLVQFLQENYNPHVYAVVTNDRVEILEGKMTVVFPATD